LKEFEAKVLGADERAKQLEYQLFLKLREATLAYLGQLQLTARSPGPNLISSLAWPRTARLFGYCRPEVNTDTTLLITEGRHPVIGSESYRREICSKRLSAGTGIRIGYS